MPTHAGQCKSPHEGLVFDGTFHQHIVEWVHRFSCSHSEHTHWHKCLPITYEVISHQRAWVMWQALNQRANEKLKRNSNKNSLRATRAVDVGGWVFQVGKYANLTGFRFYLIQLPKEQNKTWAQYIILILDWLQLIRFLTQLFMHKCIRLFIWIIKF